MNRSACGLLVALAAFLVGGSGLAEGSSVGASERVPHPEPRVIVNVLSVRGPHDSAQIQRSARFGWIRFVRCYKSKGKGEQAVINLGLLVSGDGSVRKAWATGETPRHPELASCIADALPGLAMPKAAADSTAAIEVQLAPGDRPRPGDET